MSGHLLYMTFFEGRGEVETVFRDALQSTNRLRINLETSDDNQKIMKLPWEALYVPAIRNFPALMPRYSVVHLLPSFVPTDQPPIVAPLRILALLASPRDAPPLNIDQERDILTHVLGPAQTNRTAILEFCPPTLEALRDKLRVFKPHLFHFVGHGVFDQSDNKGALVFTDDNGRGELVKADTLRSTLTDYGIQLAVLNACDTGTAATNDVITGVAGALASSGVAACIATTRAIADEAALLFAREFYSTLVAGAGYSLERALTEARRALLQEGHDWTAYALFVGSTDLDALAFTVVRGQDNQEEVASPIKTRNFV